MTIVTPDREREIPRQDKTQEESALPQGRGESLIAQLDSAVNQAEQLRSIDRHLGKAALPAPAMVPGQIAMV